MKGFIEVELHNQDDQDKVLLVNMDKIEYVQYDPLEEIVTIHLESGKIIGRDYGVCGKESGYEGFDYNLIKTKLVNAQGNETSDAEFQIKHVIDTALSEGLDFFEFTIRTNNCLKNANIHTLGELLGHTAPELLAVNNFGKGSLLEVRKELAKYGLHLKGEEVFQ